MKTKIQNSILCIVFILAISIINSCTADIDGNNEDKNSVNDIDVDSSTHLIEVNVNGTTLLVEEMENGDYLLDDMIFPKSQFADNSLTEGLSSKTESVGRIGNRWPNNTISYFIDEEANREPIEQAIRHVQLFTNLKFYETTYEENPYALGFYGAFNSCSAAVGYDGDTEHSNYINTGGCVGASSIIHEIGHSLGLWHEHSRADRDDYIIVDLANTNDDYQYQIYGGGTDGFEYTDFDFNSIMLYGSYDTSINGEPVMTRVNGNTFNGNTSGNFSDLDIEGLQEMYPLEDTKLYSIMGGNGLYVSSENGKSPITCNRTEVGRWEQFIITPVSESTIVIQDNKNKNYLTYNEVDDSFNFDGTSIDDAVNLVITEYTYGQSDYFYAFWYSMLKIKDTIDVLAIDESDNGSVKIDAEHAEFRIELIN